MDAIVSQITSLTQPFIQTQIKEIIKAPCHWPLWIHRWPVNSLHKWPVKTENVSIWWRHHVWGFPPIYIIFSFLPAQVTGVHLWALRDLPLHTKCLFILYVEALRNITVTLTQSASQSFTNQYSLIVIKMKQGNSEHYIDAIMTTMASQITSLTIVYSTVYSGADQRKHQSSASLAFVRGIHQDWWIPRTKGQ